ncbi:MAG: FHIPEP family type III secretion protein [Myxococcota bacterium]
MTTDSQSPSNEYLIGYAIVLGAGDEETTKRISLQLQKIALTLDKQLIATFIDYKGQLESGKNTDFEKCIRMARNNECTVLIQNSHLLPDTALDVNCDDLNFMIAELNETVSFDHLKLLKSYHEVQSVPVFQNRVGFSQPDIEIRLGQALSNPDFIAFLERAIRRQRKAFENENGWPFAPVQISKDQHLGSTAYHIVMFGKNCAEFQLFPDRLLALSTDLHPPQIDGGIPTFEPTFQVPAIWIDPSDELQAKQCGYTVIKPPMVLITHFNGLISAHLEELFTPTAFHNQYTELQKEHGELLSLLHQCGVTVGHLHHLFRRLTHLRIPITDNYNMLSALIDGADPGFRFEDLVKAAKKGLKIPISQRLTDEYGAIPALTVSPNLTDEISLILKMSEEPNRTHAMTELREQMMPYYNAHASESPILICSSRIDSELRKIFETEGIIFFPIFTHDDFTKDAPIEIIKVIDFQLSIPKTIENQPSE